MLDEPLEVYAPDSGLKTPRKMAVLFLQRLLGQALIDRAVAVNIVHDTEDDCLRALEYSTEEHSAAFPWREFLPAPGPLSDLVLKEVRRRIGVRRAPGEGTLHYKYGTLKRTAAVAAPNQFEVRIYFTADRPPMRTKGLPQV